MVLSLHRLRIGLRSNSSTIRHHWRQLLSGWLEEDDATGVQVELHLEVQESLPSLPEEAPLFTSDSLPHESGILDVYRAGKEAVLLHYLDGALVKVPLHDTSDGISVCIAGTVTPRAIGHGRFEDITFTSLAPALRRHGYFMVHAFAAARNGQCVLIVGPTGSGKTTTGLSLLLNGWRLLANDLVLLEQRNKEIYALPTPGIVNIRPKTVALLPDLRPLLAGKVPVYGKHNISGEALVNGRWANPQPVTGIFFPSISNGDASSLSPQTRAVALARLMAESMDRWDEAMLPQHLGVLQKLVQQSEVHDIFLGQQMSQIPALFEE